MLHSDGLIDSNRIIQNEYGISTVSDTVAKVEKNIIENNAKYGIEILDPAEPELK